MSTVSPKVSPAVGTTACINPHRLIQHCMSSGAPPAGDGTADAPGAKVNASIEADFFRGGRLSVASAGLQLGTWNVEGFTEAKLVELQMHMKSYGIDLLCLQETHKPKSEYTVTEEGFPLIFSGASADDVNETVGVGFLISPRLRRSVVGFRQASSRMASLKLRVVGDKILVCSAYAPHSGKPPSERQTFFQELNTFLGSLSCHGP
eukprot:333843-Pyramimonas_sp.AAC.2